MNDDRGCVGHVDLIVAVAADRVIGDQGRLPWHLPADLQHFKQATLGGALVMGRATYDSIGRPLPGRRTVVVTRDPAWSAPGVEVAHDINAAVRRAAELADAVHIVGGAQIYAAALAADLVDELIVSEVDLVVEGDTRFAWPDGWPAGWSHISRELREGFTVVRYRRVR